MKKVYCHRCHDELSFKDDYVITNDFMEIVAYHDACYVKEVKGLRNVTVGKQPLNGTRANLGVLFASVFALFLFFKGETVLGLLLCFLILVRLYAYYKIERHLR